MRQVIVYIHNNPVKHGFTASPELWNYSSYLEMLSEEATFIKRKEVVDLFGDMENFKYCHRSKTDLLNELRLEE